MSKILDLVRYILKNYKNKKDLSKARLNKIIFLVDWVSAIRRQKQITPINWYYNYYGPYVKDIEKEIQKDNRFNIDKGINYYGNEKNIISLKKDEGFNELSEEEKEIVDFVIESTQDLNWGDFINLVYSTYPIIKAEKFSILNLVELAKEYKKAQK